MLAFILHLQLRDKIKNRKNEKEKRFIYMSCKDRYQNQNLFETVEAVSSEKPEEVKAKPVERLLFGVDSEAISDDMLQNNLTEFEWVSRNKLYPDFWGRNIVGEHHLTKKEIEFLHNQGCKIAAIYRTSDVKETAEQGKVLAKKVDVVALELGIPEGTAVFLEIDENEKVTRSYMQGFAEMLLSEGFTPGFKVNTDAKFRFDREYSGGMQAARDVFEKCLIWAAAPSLPEFERTTTTHFIHPDEWLPFAPSGITRNDIAIWQYGKNCHPICDDAGDEVTFNVNLVRNEQVIIEKMF